MLQLACLSSLPCASLASNMVAAFDYCSLHLVVLSSVFQYQQR